MENRELNVLCNLYLMMREGETEEEALERLTSLLDSELCNLADHHINYQVHEANVQDI
jgi:hypothetical protein